MLEVQGSAYATPPIPVQLLLDAMYKVIFTTCNDDLNASLATIFLAASTRYLLAPSDSDAPVEK